MIVIVDIGNRKPELVLLGRMKGHRILFLRHVFADDPHCGHVRKLFEDIGVIGAPCTRIQKCGGEGQS